MEILKNTKEIAKQSLLKENQINTNLISKGQKLPTGEIVISVTVEKKHTWIICDSGKKYKSNIVVINNQPISFIEIDVQNWKNRYDALKKHYNLNDSDIANITGNTPKSVNQVINTKVPGWAKLAIHIFEIENGIIQ